MHSDCQRHAHGCTNIANIVEATAELLNKEGENAFPKFKGKDSTFIFGGTYIWVHRTNGTMLMHPIKPAVIVGTDVLTMKDKDGKLFFKKR